MKKLIATIILGLPLALSAQGSFGELTGNIINEDSMSVSYAKIQTESNGRIYKGQTDINGRFRISGIPAGKYAFEIIKNSDTMKNVIAEITIDGIENLRDFMFQPSVEMEELVILVDRDRLRLKYGVNPVIKMNAKEISRSPNKFDQKTMIASMSSDIKLTEDGELIFRGARKGDMIYIMDGIKTNKISNVPSVSIGAMMAYTGGIPAQYGDTTGGVVVMETKSYFDLYRDWKAGR